MDQITQISETIFQCESRTNPDKSYLCDMVTGDCECIAGIGRGPCAHKNEVAKHFNIAELLVIPSLDNKARGMYHYLATGSVLADSWYRSLDQPDQILNVQDYVEERTQQQHQPQQQYDDDDQQPGTSGMAGSSEKEEDKIVS